MTSPTQAARDAYAGKERKGKRLWWLKLPKDFFTSNNVIKKMRKLPGGDTYVVITLKLLLLSLDNDFRIYYEGVEDTFPKDIALTLDESPEAVEVTLRMLLQQGWLVQEDDDTIFAPKSQEIAGSETPDAGRMRLKRLNDKELALNAPEHCSNNVTLEKRREEKSRKEIEEMLEGKDITALFPEAFIGGKPRSSPSISEVRGRAYTSGFYAVSPEDFYGIFSSQDWTVRGKEITDWACLYLCLESMARNTEESAG